MDSLNSQMILDQYETLLRDNPNNPTYIKNQLKKKFHISERDVYKILHPFDRMRRLYDHSKQKMRNMNFTII